MALDHLAKVCALTSLFHIATITARKAKILTLLRALQDAQARSHRLHQELVMLTLRHHTTTSRLTSTHSLGEHSQLQAPTRSSKQSWLVVQLRLLSLSTPTSRTTQEVSIIMSLAAWQEDML